MIYRFFLIILIIQSNIIAQKAVCIVPVANLVGEPLAHTNSTASIEALYKNLPLNGSDLKVKRIGQLLFNEVVNILEETEKESCIEVKNHFYCTYNNNSPKTSYWTLKKNLMPYSKKDNKNVPEPLNYQYPTKQYDNIVTLKQPFFDQITHQRYSAGTRFKLAKKVKKNNEHIYISIISPKKEEKIIKAPKKLFIAESFSPEKKIEIFVETLRNFAKNNSGQIPYVLGGMSFTRRYKNKCLKNYITEQNKKLKIFQTTEHNKDVHAGFDCAGLIYRAAQIAGLPFYTKNTSAMHHHLRPMKNNEEIDNGDIIFIPGHAIAIVNKDNNQVVEARTQSHGYGFVHEINLNLLFKEIENFDDLKQFHFSKQKASRLNRKGKIIAHKPITILKMKSIFE